MRPFEGYKIVDLSHVLAGPFAAYQLAIFGAEVVKVENPDDPDMARNQGPARGLNDRLMGTNFLTQGSNKQAITLDLKTPQGREILLRLVAGADALVENYAPGVLAELGLGPDGLAAVNDKLVYCSISGFGQSGPRAGQRAYDHVIQALSGMMPLTGEVGSDGLRVGFPVLDYATGTMAAFALSAAFLQRTRTGKGQHIDLSMMDVALMMMSSTVTGYLWTGNEPRAPGNGHALSGNTCFEAKEGRIMLGANDRRQHRRLFEAIGHEEEAARDGWNERLENAASEKDMLREELASRTAAEWEDYLNSRGVPAGRVRSLAEALDDEQLGHRSLIHTHEDAEGFEKALRVPMAAFKLAHGGAEVRSPPVPVGHDTDNVLRQLGYDDEAIEAFRKAKAI